MLKLLLSLLPSCVFFYSIAYASDLPLLAKLNTNEARCDVAFPTARGQLRAVALGLQANLPDKWPVGRVATHLYSYHNSKAKNPNIPSEILTFADAPKEGEHWRVANMNGLTHSDAVPERFMVSDGTTTRSLVGIDLSPNSPLSRWVAHIIQHITSRLNNQVTLHEVLKLLQHDVANFMRPISGGIVDGKSQLPWDIGLDAFKPPMNLYVFLSTPISEARDLNYKLRVEPLESYIEHGEGYCLQQSLLSWIILRKMGFAARLVNGSTAIRPGLTFGHAWVEIGSGVILDPALHILERPETHTSDRPHPLFFHKLYGTYNWFYLTQHKSRFEDNWHDTWRFEVDRFPFIVYDPTFRPEEKRASWFY